MIDIIIHILTKQELVIFFIMLGAIAGIMVYLLQQRTKQKIAFILLFNQINSIEDYVKKLRKLLLENKLGNIEVYKLDTLMYLNYWKENKHILMKSLNSMDIMILDDYYLKVEQIEQSRKDINMSLSECWKSKSWVEQSQIAKFIEQDINNNNDVDVDKIKKFVDIFEPSDYVFMQNITKDKLIVNLSLIKSLQGSTTYEKIRKKAKIK